MPLRTWTRVAAALCLFALAACDPDAAACKTGKGVDAIGRWGSCNQSCSDKNNKESCAAAKVHAAAACAESLTLGHAHTGACRDACEHGDETACSAK